MVDLAGLIHLPEALSYLASKDQRLEQLSWSDRVKNMVSSAKSR